MSPRRMTNATTAWPVASSVALEFRGGGLVASPHSSLASYVAVVGDAWYLGSSVC